MRLQPKLLHHVFGMIPLQAHAITKLEAAFPWCIFVVLIAHFPVNALGHPSALERKGIVVSTLFEAILRLSQSAFERNIIVVC